jgi:hypothetical protein
MVIKCTHICRRARHADTAEVLTVPRRLPVSEFYLHTNVSSLCMLVPCANPVNMLCHNTYYGVTCSQDLGMS